MGDIRAASRDRRYFGMADVERLPLRIEDQPILRHVRGIDFRLGNLELKVQPRDAIVLLRADLLKRRFQAAGKDGRVCEVVDHPILRTAGVPCFPV